MNVCVDIGNTRIKCGIFSGYELLRVAYFERSERKVFKDWLTNHLPGNIILSNVGAPLEAEVRALMRGKTDFFLDLNTHTPLPITNTYATPESLGKDRLAAVVGAYTLYPGQASLVVDAGTCITYDLIDDRGTFLGGNIAPGLYMRLQAMQQMTAGLPLADLVWPEHWLGDSTEHALQGGALWGAIFELEGYLRKSRQQFPIINVLLTGGDSHFLAKKWKSRIFVHSNLVLHGLNKILHYNVERLE